jgi:hypothetical protein
VFINYLMQRIKSGKIMGSPAPTELPPAVEPLPGDLAEGEDAAPGTEHNSEA